MFVSHTNSTAFLSNLNRVEVELCQRSFRITIRGSLFGRHDDVFIRNDRLFDPLCEHEFGRRTDNVS
jgi:hypothetical protein